MKEIDLTVERDTNVRKFIVMQNIQSDENEIIFKVDKEGKNTLEDICNELGYEYEEYEKDGVLFCKSKEKY